MQQHPALSFRRWFDFISAHKAKILSYPPHFASAPQ
jgi:hypothetical protein